MVWLSSLFFVTTGAEISSADQMTSIILQQPFKKLSGFLMVPDMSNNVSLQPSPLYYQVFQSLRSIDTVKFTSIGSSKIANNFQGTTIFIANSKNDLQNALDFVAVKRLGRNGNNVLILDNQSHEEEAGSINVGIDQHVFIVSIPESEMVEVYLVNGVIVKNRVGWFVRQGYQSMFNFDPEWSPALRQNLQGAYLTALTDRSPPWANFDQDYAKTTKFFENNQTFDVTNIVTGLYVDLIKEMSEELNFTYSIYKRNDGVWGSIVDGKPTGMLLNLKNESIDLIVADFGMSLYRLPYTRYLPIVTPVHLSVVIKNNLPEEVGFLTYTKPYRKRLWFAICICSIVLAIWLHMFNKRPKPTLVRRDCYTSYVMFTSSLFRPLLTFVGWLWTTLSSYVGSSPFQNELNLNHDSLSNRIVLLSCFLGGVITWMAYQATLTSELATLKISYPFNSYETLLESDFQ